MTYSTEEQARTVLGQMGLNAVVIPTTHNHWVITSPTVLQQPANTCAICGQQFREYPNNPHPVTTGQCCAYCDDHVVTPARIALMRSTQ